MRRTRFKAEADAKRRRSLILGAVALLIVFYVAFSLATHVISSPAKATVVYNGKLETGIVRVPYGAERAVLLLASEAAVFAVFVFWAAPKGHLLPKAGVAILYPILDLFIANGAVISQFDYHWQGYFVYSHLTPFVGNHTATDPATGLYQGLRVFDAEAVLLVTLLSVCVFLVFRAKPLVALSRVVRAGCVLGGSIAVNVWTFDNAEFGIHATAVQALAGFATWFSNAALLGTAFTVAVGITLFEAIWK